MGVLLHQELSLLGRETVDGKGLLLEVTDLHTCRGGGEGSCPTTTWSCLRQGGGGNSDSGSDSGSSGSG